MKRLWVVVACVVLCVFALMGCTRVEPGYVGIKVNMVGSDKGVSDLAESTGFVFYFPYFQQIFKYPYFVQVATWTAGADGRKGHNDEIVFNTKEGLTISSDVAVSYSIDRVKIPKFYVKFRSADLYDFTHGFFRNVARDAFNEEAASYTVEEIYGVKKEEFLRKVKTRVNKQCMEYGVIIEQFGFIGDLRLPKEVKGAIDAKITAIQSAIKVENQLREAQAEAKKRIAQAEGEAKANLILAQSITQNLIEWEKLKLSHQQIARWNGVRPLYEASPGSNFLMQVPMGK